MLTLSVSAQEEPLANKHGVPVLPQTGDIAIGIDALPYLNYLGNIFNNTQNNTLDLGSQNLYFRYYITDKSAVRVNLSVGKTTEQDNFYVQDDAARASDPTSQAMVQDRRSTMDRHFSLLVGLQKSRGYGRLKGFYGVQAGYGYDRSKSEYQYGNSMTVANQAPTTHWGNLSNRTVNTDEGITNAIMAGGFVGAEYYILPKICIGGEFSLMYSRAWGSQSNSVMERFNGQTAEEYNVLNGPGDTSSSIETVRPATYGGLYVMFHF